MAIRIIPIQKRHDTAANWTLKNPILRMAEEGFETDTKKTKTGDGVTRWNDLPYDATGTGGGVSLGETALTAYRGDRGKTAFDHSQMANANPHGVSDANLVTTDVTANNASTAKHGFLRKLSGVATEFLNGQGDFVVPQGGSGGGSGTVTSVSVTTANGVSGTVANPTSAPAISLTLGNITPTRVNGIALSVDSDSVGSPSIEVSGPASISGNNTGDQFTNTTAAKLIGRGAGAAGAAQEISLGTGLSMIGTTLNATGGGGGGATSLNELTDVDIGSEQNGDYISRVLGVFTNISKAAAKSDLGVTALENGTVKTTGDQSIAGVKTFTGRVEAMTASPNPGVFRVGRSGQSPDAGDDLIGKFEFYSGDADVDGGDGDVVADIRAVDSFDSTAGAYGRQADIVFYTKRFQQAASEAGRITNRGSFLIGTNENFDAVKLRVKGNVYFEDGFFVIEGFAGSGSRMVVADADGMLSTQAIPSGGGSFSITELPNNNAPSSAPEDTFYKTANLKKLLVALETNVLRELYTSATNVPLEDALAGYDGNGVPQAKYLADDDGDDKGIRITFENDGIIRFNQGFGNRTRVVANATFNFLAADVGKEIRHTYDLSVEEDETPKLALLPETSVTGLDFACAFFNQSDKPTTISGIVIAPATETNVVMRNEAGTVITTAIIPQWKLVNIRVIGANEYQFIGI